LRHFFFRNGENASFKPKLRELEKLASASEQGYKIEKIMQMAQIAYQMQLV
jgi:hypothetical protein